jgi:CRP/FNR family transcriptional regulator
VTGIDPLGALRQIPYLRLLPPAELEQLAAFSDIRTVPRGASLFEEGQPAGGVFLVLDGRIKLVRASPQGREQVLHEERAGSTLAEVPVFDGGGYVGTAVAVEDARVCFVPRAPLLAALDRSPASAREVIRILAARVRRFAAVVEDLSLRAVTERVAGFLIREMDRTGDPRVELPATRDELAAHVGTVREQASRALSHLRAQGILEIDGRIAHVRDAGALRAAAGAVT